MSEATDLIAIVRSDKELSAVWHVDVAPSTPLMRLCGAWVTDDVEILRSVVAARVVLPFGGQLVGVAQSLAKDAIGVTDLNDARNGIGKLIAHLDETHRTTTTAAGNPRAPIKWPNLPTPLDWAALPAAPKGVNPRQPVSEMVAVARWVADLAEAWSSVESMRISKAHLARGDRDLQKLPINIMNCG